MKTINWLIASLATLTITGCFEQKATTEQLCQNNPELRCENLNMNDGQCQTARNNLISHRYQHMDNVSDSSQIKEYGIVAEYRKCLDLASQIVPNNQSDLKRRRVDALVHSISELDRIATALKPSQEPETLYFLWSQTGDTQARRQILQMEGSPKMNTAEMQYALATFYTNRDTPKTLTLLNNALTLSDKDNLNPMIVKSMASIHQKLGNMKQAYVWAMVAKINGLSVADEKQLKRMFVFSEPDEYQKLDELAKEIANSIDKGIYSPELIPEEI